MNEELKQTIERVKQQNAHVLPITNMVQHVPSDIQRLIDAAEQVEAFKHDSDGALKMLGKEIVERTLLHRRLDAVAVEAAKAHVRVGELELALGLIEADNRDLDDAHRRIAELEAQLASLLPAAQSLVTSIEFIPIPASNAAADSALLTGTGATSSSNAHDHNTSAMLP